MDHDIVLKGRHVTLEPLREADAGTLAAAVAAGDDVFSWFHAAPEGEAGMRAWIDARRTDRAQGRTLAFIQREPKTGAAMGSTSIFDWDEEQRLAEIGHTWLAAPYRRTGVNTEAKLLLLTHAFETLRLARIQIVTDARNHRSRDAILRTGAKFEGILRNHRRGPDGELRDSAYHSITDIEWPSVRVRLTEKLR